MGRVDEPPDALEEPVLPFHIGVIPFQILFRRSLEQNEHPCRVGAVLVDHNSRIDTVVLRLRHFFVKGVEGIAGNGIPRITGIRHIGWGNVLAGGRIFIGDCLHHALGQETAEGFIETEQASIAQGFGKEAGIEQVQDGVLNATHVLVHGQPAIHGLAAKWQRGVFGIAVAKEIPAGTHKCVHGVRLPLRRGTATGANNRNPVLELGQGRGPLTAEGHVAGQLHGELVFWNRNHAAARAMDHRDGAAPVALPGNQPIPQAVLHPLLTPAIGFSGCGDGVFSSGTGKAIKGTGMDEDPGLSPGRSLEGMLIRSFRNDYLLDRQLVLAGELEIPLVVGRHTHDSPGAVVGQDVIGDPKGDGFAGGWIQHLDAEGHPPFGAILRRAFLLTLAAHQVAKSFHSNLLIGPSET